VELSDGPATTKGLGFVELAGQEVLDGKQTDVVRPGERKRAGEVRRQNARRCRAIFAKGHVARRPACARLGAPTAFASNVSPHGPPRGWCARPAEAVLVAVRGATPARMASLGSAARPTRQDGRVRQVGSEDSAEPAVLAAVHLEIAAIPPDKNRAARLG
jgi:hypothetical protein